MRPSALYLSLILLLSPIPSWAEDDDKSTPTFPYTLAELEELLDSSPQLRLLSAKQQEARNKESIWHDVSVSAGFNPIRTADKFTDRIRIGFAVSMPLDILLFRDTARVSREVESLEMEKLRDDLKREVRRLWFPCFSLLFPLCWSWSGVFLFTAAGRSWLCVRSK